ncbi:uncharacterized protein MELLADRAFT_104057 [Melampsora larici-populina 98AG31]|uniref:Uncharacterized protein n=1 Tax=Melampsora larici-populina (strain 98AG31 / pathotype 3-4-7) TaxID=747676 RepID=F4RDE6_MELLP|nr:uncharacterized protein MELLADRAFT_104057 [Melampsora larici-populina 98AG31]EGG09624.1 hypothetical protein MELLADRAFT_104057 [Melampsora larici-populina 98AG31]
MVSDIRDFYKQGRTCCLAVPLFQGGIMSILYLNCFLAAFSSCMSFVGPKILALVQPIIAAYAFGALYAIVALLHIYGIVCVETNRVQYFRHFKNFTMYILAILFIMSLGVIILSSSKHEVSTSQCMKVYHFPVDPTFNTKSKQTLTKNGTSSAVQAAMTVCDYFAWAQVGVMAMGWMVMALIQLYFLSKHQVYYELKWEDYLNERGNR